MPVPQCALGSAINAVFLRVTRNGEPAGDEKLKLRGEFQGTLSPPIDPARYGADLIVRDLTGLPLFRRHLPAEYWTPNASRTRWSYRDLTGVAAGGITRATLWDDSAVTPFKYRFKVTSRAGDFRVPPESLPLRTEFFIPTDGATQCAGRTLNPPGGAAPACVIAGGGKSLRCR
jgi:hypothetical protein